MKAVSKIIAGATAVAMLAGVAATPAEAQYRYRHHDRGGIDAGDVIAGVAILGGIAAVASAIDRDGRSYGYGYRDRYRGGYNAAVESCGYEAERYGRGQVRITDVDRSGNNRFRVRGVIAGGYDRYDRGYDRRDDRYDGYDRGYDNYDRDGFTCYATGNGRILDFRVRDRARGW